MSVSPIERSQFSSDFDDTWHKYSLICNLDFVESFFFIGGKIRGKFALATFLADFNNF